MNTVLNTEVPRRQRLSRFGFNTHGNVIPLPSIPGRNITLIAAMGTNGAIGNQNTIPWSCPPDMKQFKKLTMGHIVVMGRETYESLPIPKDKTVRCLPGRILYVLSRDSEYLATLPSNEDVFPASSLEEALQAATKDCQQIFIAGGASIYEQGMPYANDIILTEIDVAPAADKFFPIINSDFLGPICSTHKHNDVLFRYMYFQRRWLELIEE